MALIRFDDDIRLVHQKLSFTKKICLGIFVKAGSREETKTNNGIAHFTEHMFFKGTKNRTAFEIAKEFSELGINSNAATGKEYTYYYAISPKAHIEKAVEIFSDMCTNSLFLPEEMAKERNVILEEIAMYQDDYNDICNENLMQNMYAGYEIGKSILGPAENVKGFEREDIISFIKDYYTRDNIVISITGAIEKDEAIELCKKYFLGKFPKSNKALERQKLKYNIKLNDVKEIKDINQSKIALGFLGLPESARFVQKRNQDILSIVLGLGLSSRLFQKVREEHGLAYSIYSYERSYSDTGYFSINVDTNETLSEKAVALIAEELNLLMEKGITLEEFEKGRTILLSMTDEILENKSALMCGQGISALYNDKFLNLKNDRKKIEKLEYDNLIELSRKIFNKKKITTSYVGKEEGANIHSIFVDKLKEYN